MWDRFALVSVIVLAVALNGCGQSGEQVDASGSDDQAGDDGQADGSGQAQDDGQADEDEQADEVDQAEEYEYESPLGQFLGWSNNVNFDEEEAQAKMVAQELQMQELAATCMREQGFEYIPVDSSQREFFDEGFEGGGEELEWGSEEFVRKYGFGVTTQRFSQEQVGPDLVGHNYPDFEEQAGEAGFVDPNQAYIDSLAEPERDAYFDALHGVMNEPEFDWMLEDREPTDAEMQEMEDWYENEYEPTGCMEIASREVWDEDGSRYQEFDDEFGDLMGEMYERVEASAELAAFRAEVEACVSEQGFAYLEQDEPYMHFEQKLEEVGLGWSDPLEGVDTEGWTDEQFQQAFEDHESQQLPPDQLAALAELQQEEINMAVAFDKCGAGWQHEQEIMDPIRVELERQFLEDNKDRLAPYEGAFGNG